MWIYEVFLKTEPGNEKNPDPKVSIPKFQKLMKDNFINNLKLFKI